MSINAHFLCLDEYLSVCHKASVRLYFWYIISYTVSVDDSSRKDTCINTRDTNECGGSHRLQ